MKTILMCEPVHYDVEYEINPWMNGNTHHVDTALAKQQWYQLKCIIEQLANVKLIEGKSGLPDMVFTANAGLVVDRRVLLSQFRNVERMRERDEFWLWFEEGEGYDISPINNDVYFEGAGDVLKGRDVYWCGYGFRTSWGGAKHVSDVLRLWYNKKAIPIKLVNENFYHFDTCFCPLNDGSVMLYRPAIDNESYQQIVDVYGEENIISVGDYDASMFACNAVNIYDVVIMNYAGDGLKHQLRERGFEVVETPMSEFMKSGGSCKCLTLEI